MATTTKTATRAKPAPAKKPPRAAVVTTTRKSRVGTNVITGEITPEMRHQMIAEAAYLRAERRGFSSGDPVDDWLAAEHEVDTLLSGRVTQLTQ